MLHVQPKIGMARFYIEETYGTRTSDIFREGSHQHGTSCEGQKKGTQIWVNGRLHAMLVFFRFGASILYNINWARGLTYLCTVDVRMDMTHVGCSEKLARSWMSSTTTSAIVACDACLRLGHRILP